MGAIFFCQLQMLFELEQRYQRAHPGVVGGEGKKPPSFIRQHFDWVAGTSTGAVRENPKK
jgi:hypothetical protein